ncbi:hypothetical protein ABZP36_028091 [Zizania latifolia]
MRRRVARRRVRRGAASPEEGGSGVAGEGRRRKRSVEAAAREEGQGRWRVRRAGGDGSVYGRLNTEADLKPYQIEVDLLIR